MFWFLHVNGEQQLRMVVASSHLSVMLVLQYVVLRHTLLSMPDDVTLKTVLDSLAAMEQRMSLRFDEMHQRMLLRFDGMDQRISGMERKIQATETKLSRQIDAIDSRLDDIEIESLPMRVAKLETSLAH